MKVRVLWSLRGRIVLEIPGDVDLENADAVKDAVYEEMGHYTTDAFQADADGYEVDEIQDENGDDLTSYVPRQGAIEP